MKFELTYTVKRQFEVPESATDEEYDALKETVIAGIAGANSANGNIKVIRIDTPAEPQPPYEISKDCD